MEDAEKEPEEAPEPSELTGKKEPPNGGSTQELESQAQGGEDGEKPVIPPRITNLQRHLQTSVTNIQTATDAKESMRRTELEKARRMRVERLETDVKSSREKFEEILRGFILASQKRVPQELQEALNKQQQLCEELLEDKRKIIKDFQQELKCGDDRYVKDLRKQGEELDLMMERMEEQIQTLTKAYREELAQIESVYLQGRDILLTKDHTDWDQCLKDLWDKQQERLKQRKKTVEEYEAKLHNMTMNPAEKYNKIEYNTKFQVLEREHQQTLANGMIMNINHIKHKEDREMHNLAHMKSRAISLQTEVKNLTAKCINQEKQLKKKNACLSEEYKRSIQRYEGMQKKIRHFAVADARKFEDMWLMIEAEVKQLVERATVIDSLICKKHLGVSWERPHVVFAVQPQKETGRVTHRAAFQMFPAVDKPTDTQKSRTAVQSESEEKISTETMKKLMELLCDESGFLLEDKLLQLLATTETDKQTLVKLGSLLHSLGLEEEDLPKLADFLLKFKHQEAEQTEVDIYPESAEGGETSSGSSLTSNLIHPNHVLPALKSFLRHRRRSSASRQPSSWSAKEQETYWKSVGNIISEDRIKLWDAAEKTLRKYLSVLTEISDIIPETQRLKQQNAELRRLLQQSHNPSGHENVSGPNKSKKLIN
ncbi:dynein regulatory complex protein 1 [Aulostomus maculatus]